MRRVVAVGATGLVLAGYVLWLLTNTGVGEEPPVAPTESDAAVADALLIEGYDLARELRWREAIEPLEEALAIAPDDALAQYWLGRALTETGELERAEALLESARDAEPDNAEFVFGLATVVGVQIGEASNPLSQMTLATRSKNLLDEALELDPELLDARLGRILYCLRAPALLGGGEACANAQLEAVRRFDEAAALFIEGWLAEENGEYREAEELHRRSIALDPDYPRVRHRLGYLLLGSRRYDEAREQFAAYARIEPYNSFAHEGLSRALEGLGQTEAALTHARRAVELDPEFVTARLQLADGLDEAGDVEGAREQYERVLALADDDERHASSVARAESWLAPNPPPEPSPAPPSGD